jgi:Peptidase A4 family
MTTTYDPSRAFRYSVMPRTSSRLTLRTLPHSVCTVHLDGASPSRRDLRVYADPEGFIRLHIRPSTEWKGTVRFVVDCDVEGRITQFPLELRPSYEATPDSPLPPEHEPARPAPNRPALTEDEMPRLTDEQLFRRGYPLRPDPDSAPRIFDSWRRAVAVPGAFVQPHIVATPDVRHRRLMAKEAPNSSYNWSGFELPNFRVLSDAGFKGFGFSHYDYVRGIWHVPAVTAPSNNYANSSFWVGLDGDATTDLVQAGTESDAVNYAPNDFVSFTVESFFAWTQFLPQQPTAGVVTGVPVAPGDLVMVEVWIGNPGSGPAADGTSGIFFLINLSSGDSTYVNTPVGATTVSGKEAVWIMERPTFAANASGIFGQYQYVPMLANYGSAVMMDAYAGRSDEPGVLGYTPYFSPASTAFTMTNIPGDTIMSTVTSLDSYTMRFDWQSFGEIEIAPVVKG